MNNSSINPNVNMQGGMPPNVIPSLNLGGVSIGGPINNNNSSSIGNGQGGNNNTTNL